MKRYQALYVGKIRLDICKEDGGEKVSSLNSGKRDISVLDFNILRNKNIDNIFCLICRFGQVISLRS